MNIKRVIAILLGFGIGFLLVDFVLGAETITPSPLPSVSVCFTLGENCDSL